MKCPKCGHNWKVDGYVRGGKKSRRALSSDEARELQKRSAKARALNKKKGLDTA